jgi:hypothetical protein
LAGCEYDGPGAYGRIAGKQRDARFAYNHIVEPKMLLWLIKAAGVKLPAWPVGENIPDIA